MMTFSENVAHEGLFAYCVRTQRERRAAMPPQMPHFAPRPMNLPAPPAPAEFLGKPVAIEPMKKIIPLGISSVEDESEIEQGDADDPVELSLLPKAIVAGSDEPDEIDEVQGAESDENSGELPTIDGEDGQSAA